MPISVTVVGAVLGVGRRVEGFTPVIPAAIKLPGTCWKPEEEPLKAMHTMNVDALDAPIRTELVAESTVVGAMMLVEAAPVLQFDELSTTLI